MSATQTKPKIQPLQDRVLVRRLAKEEKNVGGIILPDSAQQKQDIGVVVAVGPGKKEKNGEIVTPGVKKGDKIVWDRYAGTEIKLDEFDIEEFIIVKEGDIIAIIEN